MQNGPWLPVSALRAKALNWHQRFASICLQVQIERFRHATVVSYICGFPSNFSFNEKRWARVYGDAFLRETGKLRKEVSVIYS